MDVVAAVLAWYDEAARDLPWRLPGTSPWGVLVSEVMLQQTPVARVVPAYTAWLDRWPAAADLARDPAGEAVRQWGRLGYPRRALRLHEAAVTIVRDHGGEVPADHATLLAMPGIGGYTAAAVASFAYGERHVVLDTNVRRVLARVLDGSAGAPRSLRAAEVDAATRLLPADPARAVRWAVASMELGALVCTARAPRCEGCPLRTACAWHAAGRPNAAARPAQPWSGTDRQARGRLLAHVREADAPVAADELRGLWVDADQLERALSGLLADGLLEAAPGGYALPGLSRPPAAASLRSAASAGT